MKLRTFSIAASKFVALLTLLSLAGCGGFLKKPATGNLDPTPVQVVVKVPYLCGQPSPIDVVQMRDINWEIIEVVDLLFDENGEPYTGDLFALTVSDYQLLGMNTSDWIAATRQLKAQRDFYRDCIIRSREEIENEN